MRPRPSRPASAPACAAGPSWRRRDRHWSIQDASDILAQQAARLLDEPEHWSTTAEGASVDQLAARLGVSDRHVRRIFEAQFGVSPLQYLQTRRLLTAKQLLADTALPITQVALISGFASVRRFNAAFVAHYGLNPTQMRRGQRRNAAGSTARQAAVSAGLAPAVRRAARCWVSWPSAHAARRRACADRTTLSAAAHAATEPRAGRSHTGWLLGAARARRRPPGRCA